MITISLCMIVKNEEAVLGRCLESVKDIVDEIIIVDTGSNDKTKEIALKYTDKVYDFEWIEDFSAARNYAFSLASKEYQMWLDADDIINEDNKIKLLELKKNIDKSYDIVMMKYHTHFDENNNPILTSTRERIVKKENNLLWQDPIHEYIPLLGKIYYANDIFIEHRKINNNDSNRNIKIYEKQIASNKKLTPRSLYYYARELKDHGRYKEAIEYFDKFLNTNLGWIEDNIAACYNKAICYKMFKDSKQVFESLIQSFNFDAPRAEICCELGYYYIENKDYEKAVKWFLIAINCEKSSHGFILNDYYDYIPSIELAVCYFYLNDYKKAIFYNEKAAEYKPNSSAVSYNRNFFKEINIS